MNNKDRPDTGNGKPGHMDGKETFGRRRKGRQKEAGMSERETELLKEIDANLQRVYRDTLEEPIPDRFLTLIAELRDRLNTDGK
jgi:hypothetical protein